MLKPFGHVISTRILRDANGLSRGVGFARYVSRSQLYLNVYFCLTKYNYLSDTIGVIITRLYVTDTFFKCWR